MKRWTKSNVLGGFRRSNLTLDFLNKYSSSPFSNLASHPFNIPNFDTSLQSQNMLTSTYSLFHVLSKNVQLSA